MSKFKAVFNGDNVSSNKKDAFSLYEKSRFGEPKEGKVLYSIVEALYLLEKGKIEVYKDKKKISFEKFLLLARKKDLKISTKYTVFKDMRNKGFVVKTALKFGAEFRVYEKGIHPGQDHAKWILYPLKESEKITMHEFSAKSRVAHSTKKNLLIAVVDDEEDVTYYEVSWKKI